MIIIEYFIYISIESNYLFETLLNQYV